MKIYEFLGIKKFKRLVFKFRDVIAFPFTIGLPKEERIRFINDNSSNYNLKGRTLDDVKSFKEKIFFNSFVHIIVACILFPKFLQLVLGSLSVLNAITYSFALIINSYCIMLQRYNTLRINCIINKLLQREKKK